MNNYLNLKSNMCTSIFLFILGLACVQARYIPYILTKFNLNSTIQVEPTDQHIQNYNVTQNPESFLTLFDKYSWLDNIAQLIFERLLRLIKLLIQKYIMKMEITIADLLSVIIA